MRWHQAQVLAAGLGVSMAVGVAMVAQTSGDEAAIRAAIADLPKTDLRTAESVFFSSAVNRPFVRGVSKPEPTTQAPTIVAGSEQADVRIRRIGIASAGDMAYELSDATVYRRLKGAGGEQSETFDNSTLRVWKKVNGQWRVAAHFSARRGDR